MSEVIELKHGDVSVVHDPWVVYGPERFAEDSLSSLGLLTDGPQRILVPLSVWLDEHDELIASRSPGSTGIYLEGADDPLALTDTIVDAGLVAINFPTFKDGRGYSHAYLLRHRLGYAGGLRATGDILRDQLFYLKRVGFDSFKLADNSDLRSVAKALREFSETYQASIDQPIPLFRRRLLSSPAAPDSPVSAQPVVAVGAAKHGAR